MNLWPFHHRHKRRNIGAVPQEQSGIQLQSAAAGIAIPIAYGQARVASNLIHYKQVSIAVEQIVFSQTRAAIAIAVCEGPIVDILKTWYDKQIRTKAQLASAGFVTFLGTLSQTAWAFLTTNYPAEAVPYQLTAYMACPSWPLKDGASLPNYSWEVKGILPWGAGILDANPKDVVTDFLTDPHHGALFPAALLASLTAFRDYCTAAGIFMSPVFTAQRTAAEHLQEFLALANSAFVWSDGVLKIIPYGDTAITGNGVTYTPNVTPLYNLTDDDFLIDGEEDPVRVSRKRPADCYNHIQIEFDNRAKDYNVDIAEAKDQTSIELELLRTAPVMKAPQIKDANVARTVVQLALQRQVYIRNEYEFKLGFRYVLLEPMDLVTLTDLNLGLNQTTVRLTKVEEQDDGAFLCTAEEWPFGVATATLYPVVGDAGFSPDIPAITNPPGIVVSFDSTGQAILNLLGDKKTVKHIYVLRTDRVPTLAETQAGTVVNFQTQANIATGVVVAAGAAVYVGDLTYNMAGDESALVTAVFRREGSGTSAPPVPIITVLNGESDDTIWNRRFDATAGSGGGGANLTYDIRKKISQVSSTSLASGNATTLPLDLAIARDVKYAADIWMIVTDTATGLSATARFSLPAQRQEINGAGDTITSFVKESGGKTINRLLAKTLAGDADSLDGTPEGTTYKRVTTNAVDGTSKIDFTKSGFTGKNGDNIVRSAADATIVSTIVANITNAGHAASAMQESGGKAINRLLGKALAGDADSLDGAPDGTTYKKILNVSSGLVQTSSIANAAVTKVKTEDRNRCRVYHSVDQATTNSTPLVLAFDSESFDIGGLHTTGGTNSRITIVAGMDVKGLILMAHVEWAANGTGYRQAHIIKNGSLFAPGSKVAAVVGGGVTTQQIVVIDDAPTLGDYYEVQVLQTSGGGLNAIGSGPNGSNFAVIHLW